MPNNATKWKTSRTCSKTRVLWVILDLLNESFHPLFDSKRRSVTSQIRSNVKIYIFFWSLYCPVLGQHSENVVYLHVTTTIRNAEKKLSFKQMIPSLCLFFFGHWTAKNKGHAFKLCMLSDVIYLSLWHVSRFFTKVILY